jgi:zinc/manganese transport system substrate-binding protein/manganese/iron transport system substrate-binding protein
VLRSGGDLDEWLGDLLSSAGSDAETLTLLDVVRPRRAGDDADPHWWHDPRNALAGVRRIRDALSAADPGGRAAYAARAAAYAQRLRRLDAAIARCVARIPQADRRLVTDHDALGSFADRYGIEVVGTVIPALSTQAQPSARAVARLVDTIREQDVATIFPSSSVNTRLERAIARESGARVGPALYADTLGPDGSEGATYLGALRANAGAIVAGLGGGRCVLPR